MDEVIGLGASGKVLFGVVNNVVGTQRLYQVGVLGVTRRSHFGTKVFRQLDRRRTISASGPIDQYPLSAVDFSRAKNLF